MVRLAGSVLGGIQRQRDVTAVKLTTRPRLCKIELT